LLMKISPCERETNNCAVRIDGNPLDLRAAGGNGGYDNEGGGRVYCAGLCVEARHTMTISFIAVATVRRSESRGRSVVLVWPHVRAYDPALGADRPPIQVQKHGFVRPAIGVDDRTVMAVEALPSSRSASAGRHASEYARG
jgi:hypothetical protein